MAVQQHIESLADKCGGNPCVSGTRIRVWDVYISSEIEGKTPDEVVAAYPQLSLADVHAALAYYWDHKAEIDRQMKEADEFVARLKAAAGPGPFAQKLDGADIRRDSVSS